MAIYSSEAVETVGRRLTEQEQPKKQEALIVVISKRDTCKIASDDVRWLQGLYQEEQFQAYTRYAVPIDRLAALAAPEARPIAKPQVGSPSSAVHG